MSNALNVHYGNCNRDIEWNQPIVLLNNNDYFQRNLMEAIIIKLTWENNMNLKKGTYNVDDYLMKVATHQYKLVTLLGSKGIDHP